MEAGIPRPGRDGTLPRRDAQSGLLLPLSGVLYAPTDPEKQPTRQRFLQLTRTCYGIDAAQQLAIPYRDGSLSGTLPGYRFTPTRPRDTLVIFGGFDSFIEEYIPMAFFFRDAGFDIVLFEGPGQGGALEDGGLPLTHEWEKPVAAVLDHLGLDNVSLMGRSLGGYLVLLALLVHDPRLFMLRDSALTGAFGLLCLLSLPFPKPLAYYLYRWVFVRTPEQNVFLPIRIVQMVFFIRQTKSYWQIKMPLLRLLPHAR